MESMQADSEDWVEDVFNIRYSSQGFLGGGSYARVFPAVYRDAPAAIKRFINTISEEEILREVQTMKAMKGEYHTVQFLGRFVCKETGRQCILMEMAYNLSLAAMAEVTQMDICLSLKRRIAADVCLALKSLHEKGIAHQDIKPDNLVLDFGLRAKLCDFGHARYFTEGNFGEKTGTLKFKAPERMVAQETGQKYDRMKSDIYSLGKLLNIILGDEDLPIISMCLQEDALKRPSCEDLLQALLPLCFTPSYSDYKGAMDDLGDADRINLCFYWTDFNPESALEEFSFGRMLFYQKSYEQALEVFSASDDPAAKALHGIMRFHGFGCTRDIQAASQLFEGCDVKDLESEGKFHLCSLIKYYMALVKLEGDSENKESGVKDLMILASHGISLAQMRLSSFHSRIDMHSLSAGSHQRSSQRFLFIAAKAGYAHAQALVSLSFIYSIHKKTLPVRDHHYLVKSVEGGSALGKVLLDFVDERINQSDAFQSNNLALLELIAHLYLYSREDVPAERWFKEAAERGSLDGALMTGFFYEKSGDLKTAKEWLLKAQRLDKGTQYAMDHYWWVDATACKAGSWGYSLVDIYWKEGNFDECARIIRNFSDDSQNSALHLGNVFADYSSHPTVLNAMQECRSSMTLDNLLLVGTMHLQKGTGHASEWLEEGSRRGDGRAINALGCMKLKQGAVLEAIKLFEAAAALGDGDGLVNLGIMKREQENDLPSAYHYLNEAVKKRNPHAMVQLASMLLDNDMAIQLLEKAADIDHDYLLPLLNRQAENAAAAAFYRLEKALRNIEYKTMVELGIDYEDMDTFHLLEKSAATRSSRSLYLMGIYLISEGNDDMAYRYLAEAAEAGHRESLLACIAMCENDIESSNKWRALDRERGFSGLLADEYNLCPPSSV